MFLKFLAVDKLTAKVQKRLAKKIVALRAERGWSQEECADSLEIATAYLSRLERGVVNPTLRNLIKVASGFGLDVAELLQP